MELSAALEDTSADDAGEDWRELEVPEMDDLITMVVLCRLIVVGISKLINQMMHPKQE